MPDDNDFVGSVEVAVAGIPCRHYASVQLAPGWDSQGLGLLADSAGGRFAAWRVKNRATPRKRRLLIPRTRMTERKES